MNEINEWTKEEIEILKEKYQIYGYKISELLITRTPSAIYCKAGKLRIKSNSDGRYKKGNIPWIKGKHQKKESIEKSKKGRREWYKNPDNTEKIKKMFAKSKKGREKYIANLKKEGKYEEFFNKTTKKAIEARRGLKFTKEQRQRCSDNHWTKNPKYNDKFKNFKKHSFKKGNVLCLNRKIVIHHTKPELRFEEIVKRYKLPYKYVGDGQIWMGYPPKNPDFINVNGEKKIVEISGVYWHLLRPQKEQPNLTRKDVEDSYRQHYSQYAFDCVVLWDDELNDEKHVLEQLGVALI